MKRLLRLIPVLVIGGAIYGAYWYTSRPPTSMLLTGVVTTEHITVSPQITGRVTELKVREGELDAAIYGADLPKDPALTSLIPDPDNAARTWYARHKVVPINHMVVVTEKLARSDPQAVAEIYRLLRRAKAAAGLPKPGEVDFLPFGLNACRGALETIINYALQQRLIPRKLEVEDLFDDTTRSLES